MENKDAVNALKDIRDMMEKSTKCLSLSGLSGIFMGIYALAGAWAVHYMLNQRESWNEWELKGIIVEIALLVLALAVGTAAILSEKRAKTSGQSIFNKTARRMHADLFIHLIPGGVLSIAMGLSNHTGYITSVMLLFYGLALISAAKYTFKDIKYLGYCILILGCINCFLTTYSLLCWSIGFGVCHIIYGAVMYFKYDRKKA